MNIYLNDEMAYLNKGDKDCSLNTLNFEFNNGDIMKMSSLSQKISRAYNSIIENELKSINCELPLNFTDSYNEFLKEEDNLFPYEEALSSNSLYIVINKNWQLEITFKILKEEKKIKDSEIKITNIKLKN
ncbi:hypothetical protein [Clostridium perfringens]|uniref:hypothetical protein n=1 Tax=Clostridium perfringens TaxID=1502 RepID=UPI00156ED133|nr:hypothetical protein [Clostridium perfringens]MDU7143157.1 hypothetical protein [Anaerococcus vaginalis]MDU7943371.1 hypothetical protein [Streptococcus salivarius]MDU7977659.1 hypothetical protein [Clostridioides difficile]MBI6024497.1 hypothetical protein [Clostridium perfringens]MBI6048516.1 hypothetical protein [Clostridium perfringens]